MSKLCVRLDLPKMLMINVACFSMLLSSVASETMLSVTLDKSTGKWSYDSGTLDPKATARGTFEDGLNQTGWGLLDIHTSNVGSDDEQHFGAGLVEGYLTADQIYPSTQNNLGMTFDNGTAPAAVAAFLTSQDAWARRQVKSNPSSTFWQHIGAIFNQFDGLVAGYNYRAQEIGLPKLSVLEFQIINAIGDLFQIVPAVEKHLRPDWDRMTRQEKLEKLRSSGHCSALVKVLGGLDDLFMAHSSWFEYSDMNRIFKHYHFEFVADTGAHKISFSSYPGYLESLDDFYMMDSGLGMIQTSNGVMNNSLYDLITPNSLLAWQRVRAASAIATTGEEWWQTFKTAASGTYVNQYMVVDFNKFTPGQPLPLGTLFVVEEIPGLVAGGDQTQTLARGYWPSYNVPYYAEVYRRSGYDSMSEQKENGPLYDGGGAEYTIGAPRSKFFRRDQGKVVDMESFKNLLRYANYSDPYSIGSDGTVDYGAAICMRGDLGHGGQGGAGGCYDTKVTSFKHGFFNLTCEAVNGPTSKASSSASMYEPFMWRSKDANHLGLPAVYDFPFLTISPKQI